MEADKFPEPLWGRSEVLRSCFLLVPIPRREERKVTCGGYGRGMWTEPSREQRQEQGENLQKQRQRETEEEKPTARYDRTGAQRNSVVVASFFCHLAHKRVD